MASSFEMFLALTVLIVNSFIMFLMYFVGNIILAPIVNWAEKAITGAQAVPIGDITWLIPSIWGLLITMEIVLIISFFIVVGRRQVVDDYY